MKVTGLLNKVIVIESLTEGELKTGSRLFEDRLMHLDSYDENLSAEFFSVEDADSFINCLRTISQRIPKENIVPIIHIECHGDEDGLMLADGSHLPWNRFRNELIKINFASRLNALIVVGACGGANLIGSATQMDGAPFFGVIGVKEEVKAGDLENRFRDFYSALFEAKDGDVAMDALNKGIGDNEPRFGFIGARALFEAGFRSYYWKFCRGKGKRERIEFLVSRFLQNPEIKSRGIKYARSKVKEQLSKPEDDFEFFRKRFFFTDQLPEVLERFPMEFEDVIRVPDA
ncbi:hypothetical protein A8B84_20020 [Marinobacter sp. EhC06]|jgi:hypothetical protein|uniref:hypothetical protein n=1 Tax=Marinobacter TaxID=2742 RepID=UPI0007D9DAB0|nr:MULTISPECIES: hypothetical protein [unclassified Marinobacter]OAN93373.1 hypothetical protein A8B80_17590 [Marinobacter sp. EhN04]OAN94382.1 hypothetical protein A8B84_20020 [Marinobacter sp. EhC06]